MIAIFWIVVTGIVYVLLALALIRSVARACGDRARGILWD